MSIDVNVTNDLVIVTESSEDITVNVSNAAGSPGVGVPVGGTTGQVLKKLSGTNYDTYWAADGQGVPYSGASGSVNLGPYDLTVNELTIGKGLNGVANNTALGKRTLFHNTTGNYNTAVGHEAGHNITTGQYNTAIGQSAMFTATTAGQNTAIGLNALLLTTSGGSNVAVGLDTLQHITTGSSNTAIGYNAGSHITGGSTPNTTATNSVFIGRDSKAAADGQTNQIVIGQNAVGNGSNTATFGNTATTANYFTGSINSGSFVKSGGTSSQFLKADGSVDSSSYVGGTGATGQVAYWNGTNSQTGSNNLFWDAANSRLGIGTNAPAYKMHVFNSGSVTSAIEASGAGASSILRFISPSQYWTITNDGTSAYLTFNRGGTDLARFTNTGNLMLQNGGTFTDGGQRLQVYGDAFIKGSGATSATNALVVQDSAGTQLLKIQNDGTANIPYIFYVGQNSTNPFLFSFDGNSSSSPNASSRNLAYYNTNTTQTGDQTHFALVGNALSPTSGDTRLLLIERSFAPTSGTAIFTAQRIIPTINQTGGANGITRGLYVNPTLTAAADWRSIEWSNNSGWGLYGAGTANNYLNGNLGIGITPSAWSGLAQALQVQRLSFITSSSGANDAYVSSNAYYDGGWKYIGTGFVNQEVINSNGQFLWRIAASGTAGNAITFTQAMTLTAAGRLLLGTTTEGTQRLQVAGTTISTATNIPFQSVVTSSEMYNSFFVNTSTLIGYIGNGDGIITNGGTNNFGIRAEADLIFAAGGNNRRITITSGGNLLVGTTTDVASSKVTIASTTQGFLPPRMTTTEKNAISSPAAGLIVYDTTLNKLCVRTAAAWETITSL